MIVHYAPLVKYVSGRVAMGLPPTSIPEDLNSYGIFGLVDAVEKFEPDRGRQVRDVRHRRESAAPCSTGLREQDWVPRTVRQKARRLEQTIARLEARLGRSATDAEVSEAMNMSLEEYTALLSEIRGTGIVSLDEWWARTATTTKGSPWAS